jgi:hypothetical protein
VKKITIQFMCLAMVIMALSVTETFAQQIRLKDGKATVRATIGANSEKTYTISGKDFRALSIKQTNRVSFRYELRRGSEFLSSGQTTGLSLEVESDGRSTYSIKIINESNVARRIVLGFIGTGGGAPIV